MKKLLCAALAAISLAVALPNPVAWNLAGAPAKPVKPGARFTVKLTAHIQEGWHVYSMKPIEDGPVPTRVWTPRFTWKWGSTRALRSSLCR